MAISKIFVANRGEIAVRIIRLPAAGHPDRASGGRGRRRHAARASHGRDRAGRARSIAFGILPQMEPIQSLKTGAYVSNGACFRNLSRTFAVMREMLLS